MTSVEEAQLMMKYAELCWRVREQLQGMRNPCCRRNLPCAGLEAPAPEWKVLGTARLRELWDISAGNGKQLTPGGLRGGVCLHLLMGAFFQVL